MKNISIFLVLIILALSCKTRNSEKYNSETYTWKSVQITGGGFVDGIVFHPNEKNLRYARTDMGGAYRWEETQQTWIPLTDWISYEQRNLMEIGRAHV